MSEDAVDGLRDNSLAFLVLLLLLFSLFLCLSKTMSSKGNPKDGDDADHDYFFRHAHDYDYGDELGGNEYSDEDDSDADDGTFRRPLTVADSTDTDSGGSVAVLEETSDSNGAFAGWNPMSLTCLLLHALNRLFRPTFQ